MTNIGIIEQLAAMKTMTLTTGAIHEAQALQLRNYPLLIEGVKSSKVLVDIDHKIVTYKLKMKRGKFDSVAGCKRITEIIQKYLLWDTTTVVFMVGDKVLYDSRL